MLKSTVLKYGLLGLLDDKSMTGYELMKYFNESLNFFWNAQTSQIYRDLGVLEKNGFLESKIEKQSTKPDKKLYTITKSGKESLLLWLNDCDFSSTLKNRDSLLIKVFFSSKGDSHKLISGLQDYIALNMKQLESYTKVTTDIDKYSNISEKIQKDSVYWRMTVSKGIILAKGNIEWGHECLEILKSDNNNNL